MSRKGKLIGLTGNIGAGKSTVSWMFEELGVPVLDADEIAHETLEPQSGVWKLIYERHGNAVIGRGGKIDRPALAGIIFQDPKERKYLESIIHPQVRSEIARRSSALFKEGRPFVIAEVPLLFEAGWEGDFEAVIVVRCGEELAIARCMEKFGMSRDEVLLRLAAQYPTARKAAAADAVIDNDGAVEETRVQVQRLHMEMVKGAFPGKKR